MQPRCRVAGRALPTGLCPEIEVVSPSALLGSERATALLRDVEMPVPAGSAWVVAGIDLGNFASRGGDVDEARLAHHARQLLRRCDCLIDRHRWPAVGAQFDAWFNRRVAIELRGIGELVVRRGADVSSWQTLCDLDAVVTNCKQALVRASRELAQRDGLLPAVRRSDPALRLSLCHDRRPWRRHWRRALREHGLRHRQLLALAPYGLLPAGRRAGPEYADLLPLLARADVISLAAGTAVDHWNSMEFNEFRRRFRAVLQRPAGAGAIAKAV